MYIRAGIDGAVNWVPRVERNRRQVCGLQPSGGAAGAAPAQRSASSGPELITLPVADQPTGAPAQAAVPTTTAPQVIRQQKPRRVAPVPVAATPAPAPKPQAQSVRRVQRVQAAPLVIVPAPAATVTNSGSCSGLSAVSRKYTNSTGVRCGPQSQSPVTYGPQSSIQLPADTRVLPAHLYNDRKLAEGGETPAGYRTVWQDGRLNAKRAEQDLYPQPASNEAVPAGFVRVPSSKPRLNPTRGQRTVEGDARMAQVWTDRLPRKLVATPTPPTIVVDNRTRHTGAQLGFLSADVSTQLAQPARYIRADVFSDATQAQQAAQRLSTQGLPVRMGRLTRQGQVYKVVLAGPFFGAEDAQIALSKVQGAGFARARLSK